MSPKMKIGTIAGSLQRHTIAEPGKLLPAQAAAKQVTTTTSSGSTHSAKTSAEASLVG